MKQGQAASEQDMLELGRTFAESVAEGGCVLGLVGDLGAGKTHFCKGVVQGLGSEDSVTSPTFSLVQEYPNGRLPVFHFDFYRLDSIDELDSIGWEEYLMEPAVLLVEWADKFPEALPPGSKWCRFSILPDGSRKLIFE